MKKLLLTFAFAALAITCSFAQKGETSIGFNLNRGGEIESFGIGAKFNYNITDEIRFAPSLNYYFRHNFVSLTTIDADVHYLFPLEKQFALYPIAGVTFQSWNAKVGDISATETRLGLNLGGGAQYDFNEQWRALAEIKYSIVNDADQIVFTLGVAYKF